MALDLLLLSHNVSIGDSALTVPLPVNVQLSKGMEFLTMDSAVDHVTNYLFAHKIPHKMKESRPAFKMYVCSHKPDEASGAPKPKCAFKVGLNKRQDGRVVVSSYVEHDCNHVGAPNMRISAKKLAKLTKSSQDVTSSVNPKALIEQVEKDWGFKPSYSSAWRARKHKLEDVYGDVIESFRYIPAYFDALCASMPGTVATITKGVGGVFQSAFLCIAPSQAAVVNLRPVFAFDTCAVKSKVSGVMHCFAGYDGEGQHVPIAIGFYPDDSDAWFQSFVTSSLTAVPAVAKLVDLTLLTSPERVVSDARVNHAQKGYCLNRLEESIGVKFKIKLHELFLAGQASTKKVHEEIMSHIKDKNALVHSYLVNLPKDAWAVAYAKHPRFGILSANLEDCFKACLSDTLDRSHFGSLTSYVEYITHIFLERKFKYNPMVGQYPPELMTQLQQTTVKAQGYTCTISSEHKGMVTGNMQNIVDLQKKTCDCGYYQQFLVPCEHVLKFLIQVNRPFQEALHPSYRLDALKSIYSAVVEPVATSPAMYVDQADAAMVPPQQITKRGRPAKMLALKDAAQKKNHCSICKSTDHNAKTHHLIVGGLLTQNF